MWTLVTLFVSQERVVRRIAALVLLTLSFGASAEAISLLPNSKVQLTEVPGKFSAMVCIGAAGVPLSGRNVELGIAHAVPSSEGRAYQFEEIRKLEKVFPIATDNSGCLVIEDTVTFGEYGQLPIANHRGREIWASDPIAERVYGMRITGVPGQLIVHVILNRGIASGFLFLEFQSLSVRK